MKCFIKLLHTFWLQKWLFRYCQVKLCFYISTWYTLVQKHCNSYCFYFKSYNYIIKIIKILNLIFRWKQLLFKKKEKNSYKNSVKSYFLTFNRKDCTMFSLIFLIYWDIGDRLISENLAVLYYSNLISYARLLQSWMFHENNLKMSTN